MSDSSKEKNPGSGTVEGSGSSSDLTAVLGREKDPPHEVFEILEAGEHGVSRPAADVRLYRNRE